MAITIGKSKIGNSHRGFQFEIKKGDIENGQPNDPCACAAARALKRAFDAREVRVYRDVTYIVNKNGEALRYHTSTSLRLETIVFDRNGEFYPGTYMLEPMPITRLVAPKKNASSSSAKLGRNPKKRTYRGIPNVRPTASQKLPGA